MTQNKYTYKKKVSRTNPDNIFNIYTIYAGPHPPAGLVPAQAGEVTASTLEAGGGLHGAAGTG